ncbi:MAG: hypothetical protein ABW061_20635 [Polyangiaceae bacterium]
MAVSGEARGKKYSGDELKIAVREFCLVEFQKQLGKPWDSSWEKSLRYDAEHPRMRTAARERKARSVYTKLQRAMLEAEEFAKSPTEGGRTANYLRWWVPQFISPLLKHASMNAEPKDFGKNLEDPRSLLANTLDSFDIFGLPPAVAGGSSFLDAREHALVSLIVGNWPTKKLSAATVAEIIDLETAAMRHHMKAHGANGGPQRGPKKRGAKRKHEK